MFGEVYLDARRGILRCLVRRTAIIDMVNRDVRRGVPAYNTVQYQRTIPYNTSVQYRTIPVYNTVQYQCTIPYNTVQYQCTIPYNTVQYQCTIPYNTSVQYRTIPAYNTVQYRRTIPAYNTVQYRTIPAYNTAMLGLVYRNVWRVVLWCTAMLAVAYRTAMLGVAYRNTRRLNGFSADDSVGWLVEYCFTSTETVGLLGTGAQDVHLDFHTAPDL